MEQQTITRMEFFMNEEVLALFTAYKDLKKNDKLYSNINLPKTIIKYFIQFEENKEYNLMIEQFKCRYIYSESEIEKAHSCSEKEGLSEVYDYLNEKDKSDYLSIYKEVIKIHKLLFSKVKHPEFGGEVRNIQVFLPGTAIELTEPENIAAKFCDLYDPLERLAEFADKINVNQADQYLEYIKECIRIKCELIRIHPFFDGNGRVMRAFLNLLFKKIDLPPVYITPKENKEYRKNMQSALSEGNFESITNFYLFKLCDSIAELNYGILTSELDNGNCQKCEDDNYKSARRK